MNEQPFESVRDLVTSLAGYIPTIVAGLAVLLLGLLAAWAASHLLVRVLVLMRLDRVMARLRWTSALESADARHTLFEILGTVLGVFIFLVFVANALVIWQLTVLSDLFTRVLLKIPEMVAAGLILLVGWGTANLATRAVQQLLFREHFRRARLVATLVRWVILVTAFAAALVELKVAVTIVTGAFLIVFGTIGLCLALAVGLGSRRGIELMWEDHFRRQQQEAEAQAARAEAKNGAD
jgi:Mechanosensitive ion channel, conserved TM helix